jgi:hypothetical protein
VKFLANENHTFCDSRYVSLENFDTLIFFLHFFKWFSENEGIVVSIFVVNPCASSLTLEDLGDSPNSPNCQKVL